MLELIVEHLADRLDRLGIRRIRIPSDQGIDEGRVHHGGIVLPVRALQSLAVVNRIDEVDLEPSVVTCIHWDFVFDEIPAKADDVIVAEVFIRLIPSQQLTLRIQNYRVPGHLCVDINVLRTENCWQ